MDIRCRIEMFGEMRVLQGDQVHTRFRTHKAAMLLAYLALHLKQAHPRDRLLELFWSDMEVTAARLNLNTTLSQLRRQLEPVSIPTGSILVADRQQVRLNPQAVSTDVTDFDRLMRQARQEAHKDEEERNPEERKRAERAQATLLQQVVELYRGSLLPNCYEAWAAPEQMRCQSDYLECLLRLAALWEEEGRYAEALAIAQRATTADPYEETGYQAQMRLLIRLRKPSAALQTFDAMEELFQRDLGARPSASTRRMAEMIRQDPRAVVLMRAEAASKIQAAREPTSPSPPASTPEVTVPASPALPVPALPLQLTRFFGREREREQIAELLQAPGVRLVTLLGPGGAGKTRLAIEAAGDAMPIFHNRVWFVSLADVPDATLIPPALAHALRLPPDTTDPLERAASFLTDTPSLLVMDNLEHLLGDAPEPGKSDNPGLSGAAGLIRLLLQRAPGLVCLATSRQPLRLGGEHQFPLPPLTLPALAESPALERLVRNDSVALYVDRARAVRPDFALTPQNALAVATLCRRLEGMPLAIEMAAAWVKTIPPQKMLERLGRQLDLLVSRRRELPLRHQSLRATIEWSYELLSPELRQTFACLSVFRGGWTLEAAEAVCGEEVLFQLEALQEQSLIVAVEEEDSARYRMLEPLREFAAEKLTEEKKEVVLRHAHAAYFLEQAEEAHRQFDSPTQAQLMAWFRAEQENIRTALDWLHTLEAEVQAAAHSPESNITIPASFPLTPEARAEQELRLALAFHRFLDLTGRYRESAELLQQAFQRTESLGNTVERTQAAHRLGMLHWYRGDYATSEQWHAIALTLAEGLGDKHQMGSALNGLANTTYYQGRFEEARGYYEQALAIARELKNSRMLAVIMSNLALVASYSGDYEQAQAYFEESLILRRQLEDRRLEIAAQYNLAEMYVRQGDCARGETLLTWVMEEARALSDRRQISYALHTLAGMRSMQGRYEEAWEALRECLTIRQEIGERWGVAVALETCGAVALAQNAPERAARLYGAAHRMLDQIRGSFAPHSQQEVRERIQHMRDTLGPTTFGRCWEEGSLLSEEQVLSLALP